MHRGEKQYRLLTRVGEAPKRATIDLLGIVILEGSAVNLAQRYYYWCVVLSYTSYLDASGYMAYSQPGSGVRLDLL